MVCSEIPAVMITSLLAVAKTQRVETRRRVRDLLAGGGDVPDRSAQFRAGMVYVLNQQLADWDGKIASLESQLEGLGSSGRRMVTYPTEEK
jgi:hypothetical protein